MSQRLGGPTKNSLQEAFRPEWGTWRPAPAYRTGTSLYLIEGHRIVITSESTSARQECPMLGPHIA